MQYYVFSLLLPEITGQTNETNTNGTERTLMLVSEGHVMLVVNHVMLVVRRANLRVRSSKLGLSVGSNAQQLVIYS